MSSDYRSYDSDDHDDCLFPAYAEYINGVNTPYSEAPVAGHNSLLHTDIADIPYTNRIPSNSSLYPPSHCSSPSRSGPAEPISGSRPYLDMQDSSLNPDLRSPPSYPELRTLMPPQPPHTVPQPFRSRGVPENLATSIKRKSAMSADEITRPEPLGVSPEPSVPVVWPDVLDHNHFRPVLESRSIQIAPPRSPVSQHVRLLSSSLLSSSDVDTESQSGSISPSGRLRSAKEPLPVSMHLQNHPYFQQQSQQPPVSFIKPGELLDDTIYADIPETYLRCIDAQITSLYHTANNHPEIDTRRLALKQIGAVSAKVHDMVHGRRSTAGKLQLDREPQIQAHTQTQNSNMNSTARDSRFSQQEELSEDFEQPVSSSQYDPYAPVEHMLYQAPIQQSSQHDTPSTPYTRLPTTCQFIPADSRDLIDGQLPKYLYANRLIAMPCTNARGHAERSAAQNWQDGFRAGLSPAGLQYLDEKVAQMVAPQNQTEQHPSYLHTSVQASRLLQHVQNHPQEIPSFQQVPVVPITEPLRLQINSCLPHYFHAIEVCGMPSTADNAEWQQTARNFLELFTTVLPPEGHAYIEEITQRMEIAMSEDEDVLT